MSNKNIYSTTWAAFHWEKRKKMRTEIKYDDLPLAAQNAVTEYTTRLPKEIERDFSFYKDGNAFTVMEKMWSESGPKRERYLAFWNGSYWEDKFGFVEEFDM